MFLSLIASRTVLQPWTDVCIVYEAVLFCELADFAFILNKPRKFSKQSCLVTRNDF